MTNQANFDIESFQNEVLATVQEVDTVHAPVGNSLEPAPLALKIFIILKKRSKEYSKIEISKAETKEVIEKAEKVVTKKDVRKILCPALQSASNDAYDIAKIITPILVSLSLAGTISVPLNPLVFATIALMIARMGIASMCVENKNLPEVKSGS